jgi:hypothetical protein
MRSYTAIAIEKLAHLVQHAKSEQACIAAASELLSRGWGKPTQPIAGDDEMSPGQRHSRCVADGRRKSGVGGEHR